MASSQFARSVAVRSLPLVVASSWSLNSDSSVCTKCEKPTFQEAKCIGAVRHTHDTRLITLQLPSNWNEKGAVANVLVRAEVSGVQSEESGCCACCKCPPGSCSCPKTETGCCACCSCKGTCDCPKQVAPTKAAAAVNTGCCSCCKCDPGTCTCRKNANGCCSCCKCDGTCSCTKVEAPATSGAEGESSMVARPYNPLSATSGNRVTLLVKRYGESAKMGSKLRSLKEGDVVEVKGPNKQWTIPEPGKIKEYVMIAGGTGITPIYQATEFILENDKDAKVSLYTFNKTQEDLLLGSTLMQLMLKYRGRLVHKPFVEHANKEFFKDLTFEFEATPNLELLRKLLPKPTDHEGKVMVCVCGRPGMTAAVAGPKTKDYKQGEVGGVLKELGFSKEQVRKF